MVIINSLLRDEKWQMSGPTENVVTIYTLVVPNGSEGIV